MSRDNYEVQCAIAVMGGPEKVLEKARRLDEVVAAIETERREAQSIAVANKTAYDCVIMALNAVEEAAKGEK